MTVDVRLFAAEAKASVSAVCRTLELKRATVYAREKATLTTRAVDTVELDAAIREEFKASGRWYGSPRVYRALKRKGRKVGRKRVERRRRALGLQGRRPKRFRKTTQSDPQHVPAPNILERRFTWPEPNPAWVGDITYVWTRAGWAFLALVVDLCSRRITGWAVTDRCDTALALKALSNAVGRHRPTAGLIHHTDRGSTYTASDYRKALDDYERVASMSAKGNCWDNAAAESTIGTVKTEALGDYVPGDLDELRRILFPYIEGFYNQHRLHSSLDYPSPAEKERDVLESLHPA
ncbi:IS3 family transposase [Myxococcota bacterium]